MRNKKHGFRGLFCLFAILGISLFLSLFLVGCEKDVTDPSVPVEKPEISTHYTTTNGMTTLYWEANYADSCFMQDSLIALQGSKTLPNCDTIITFSLKGKGGNVSKDVFVSQYPMPEIIIGSIGIIPYGGGEVSIPYEAKNATKIIVNDTGFYKSRGVLTFNVITTTTFNIKVVGDGGCVQTEITVLVYVPSEIELILSGSWSLQKEVGSYYNNDGPWVEFSGPDGTIITFSLSPTKTIRVDTPDGSNVGAWIMEGDKIFELGRIFSVSDSELIIEYESVSVQPGGPVPWFVHEIYSKI